MRLVADTSDRLRGENYRFFIRSIRVILGGVQYGVGVLSTQTKSVYHFRDGSAKHEGMYGYSAGFAREFVIRLK